MNFEYSEEQQQLADSLRKYLSNEYDFEKRKAIVQSASGVSDAAWSTFAELGLTAIALPEADGGFGGGAVDLMGPMEACGEALVVEPLLDNIALRRLGTPQDIAHAVLFFASPFAGWISGQTLAVDGGK